jgi:hypothetical protein
MKFLCLGYLDVKAMDALPESDLDAIMKQCWPHMKVMYATGQVLVDAGLEAAGKHLRREGGAITVTDGPYAEAKELIGGAVLIEAKDMEDAIRVASLHPALQLAEGERLGWRMEVRPLHYFEGHPAAA